MSNNRLKLFLAILCVLLFGLFAWMYYGGLGGFDWNETNNPKAYKSKSEEPHGLTILENVLKGYFPSKQCTPIENSTVEELKSVEGRPANYVFVGEATGQDSLELEHLLDFVSDGNRAFLSLKTIPIELMKALGTEIVDCDDFLVEDISTTFIRDTFSVHLYNEEQDIFSFAHVDQNEPTYGYNHYIKANNFYCESNDTYMSLGYVEDEDKVNFASFLYGEGTFFIHTTPLVFTNYHLLRKDGRGYAEKLFNALVEGPIYLDNHAKITKQEGYRRNTEKGFRPDLPKNTPLATLLSHKSLAWAWYLSLFAGMCYVIFRGKRQQRVIPILPKNTNTSKEFIDAIAHLHFKEKNYQGIGIQKMRLFLAYLRERFNINLQPDPEKQHVLPNKTTVEQLSKLSNVPIEKVESIFSQYEAIVDYAPTNQMLIDFYQSIEEFRLLAK